MGFSTNLQGRGAHEALLARQDAEVRLLETMRRCVAAKARCDRDYASALAQVATQGLKIDRQDDLAGSLIAGAWRSLVENWDSVSKQWKLHAEHLEQKSAEALAALLAEKRKARKLYQEEHARIAQQFSHVRIIENKTPVVIALI